MRVIALAALSPLLDLTAAALSPYGKSTVPQTGTSKYKSTTTSKLSSSIGSKPPPTSASITPRATSTGTGILTSTLTTSTSTCAVDPYSQSPFYIQDNVGRWYYADTHAAEVRQVSGYISASPFRYGPGCAGCLYNQLYSTTAHNGTYFGWVNVTRPAGGPLKLFTNSTLPRNNDYRPVNVGGADPATSCELFFYCAMVHGLADNYNCGGVLHMFTVGVSEIPSECSSVEFSAHATGNIPPR